MNVLKIALSQVGNLIASQNIEICNEASSIENGIARLNQAETIEAIAHLQPLNDREIKEIAQGVGSAIEYYRIFILGDNLDVVKSALNQNKKSYVFWNGKKFLVYSVKDWSLNGWIEASIVLKGKDV